MLIPKAPPEAAGLEARFDRLSLFATVIHSLHVPPFGEHAIPSGEEASLAGRTWANPRAAGQ
jgi:hypothetical protein